MFNKLRNNQQISKEEILANVDLDLETFLNKELQNLNKLDEYKNELSENIINICNEEHKSESIEKHGNIFRKHFWESVWMQARSSYIVILASGFWWAVQIVPPIISFIATKDGMALVDAFSSFSFNVPSYFVELIQSTIRDVSNFKVKTKCNWKFIVWNKNGYFVTI